MKIPKNSYQINHDSSERSLLERLEQMLSDEDFYLLPFLSEGNKNLNYFLDESTLLH